MLAAANRAKLSIAGLFEMIDKRGDGVITRADFEDVFKNLKI